MWSRSAIACPASIGIRRRDRGFLPSDQTSCTVHLDEPGLDRARASVADRRPAQRNARSSLRRRPYSASRRIGPPQRWSAHGVEEAVNCSSSQARSRFVRRRARDVSRHRDAGGDVPPEVTASTAAASDARSVMRMIWMLRRESVRPRRQILQPLGDVVAIEPFDVRLRRSPARMCPAAQRYCCRWFGTDVSPRLDPAVDEIADRLCGRGALVRSRSPARAALRAARWLAVGAELAWPGVAGLGVDAVDAHDPAATLLADARDSGRLPGHSAAPGLIHL